MKFKLTVVLMQLSCLACFSQDTLKVMTSNLLNYTTSNLTRDQYYRTILRHVKPDILVVQEMTTQAAVDNYYDNVVNLVFPGQFSKGVFVQGTDTNNEIFFKSSKMSFISNTPIHTALRDISEFKLVHTASAETLRVYSAHLKASSGAANEVARAAEVDSLRKVTNKFAAGKYFMIVGDFNIYGSTEAAYQALLQDNSTDDGNFVDTLHMTGTWNNVSYAPYHTQSPRVRAFGGGATGGMDDRFDLILFSRAIAQGGRVSYIGSSMAAIGNDGNHYNDSINRFPNTAVPDSVANALYFASDHLPVTARFVFPTSPVPIQLSYFNCQVNATGDSVVLRWATVSELNNYGFEIQKKRPYEDGYRTLAQSFVAGHGTTSIPHSYSFSESAPTAGSWQYRIQQTDLDGSIHFTEPLQLEITTGVATTVAQTTNMLSQNYPNPFNPSTEIRFTVGQSGLASIIVYDILGRRITSLFNNVAEAGREYSVSFDATNSEGQPLASGVYFYRLQFLNSASSAPVQGVKRMVIVR